MPPLPSAETKISLAGRGGRGLADSRLVQQPTHSPVAALSLDQTLTDWLTLGLAR